MRCGSQQLTLIFVSLCLCNAAAAQEGDGVYRRFDHDLVVALGVGAGAVFAADTSPSVVVEARARVIDAAGPVVSYRHSPDAGGQLFLGVELRPLWPALFLTSSSMHREFWDLLLQSIGVELGAVFLPLGASPDGLDLDVGVALGIGVAIEVPLLLPGRTSGALRGLSLRLAARRVDATRRHRGTDDVVDLSEWSANATLQIAIGAGVGAAAEPLRYRPTAM